ALPPPPDRGAVVGRAAVFDLAVLVGTEGAAQLLVLIDREAGTQGPNPALHVRLDPRIALFAIVAKPFEHVRHHVGDVPELGHSEAPRRPRRRADADAAGLDRRQRVEGNSVLVAGDR